MIQLVVTVDDKGALSVSGPLENKVICLGMLELAKDAVRAHETPKIQPASVNDLERFKLTGGK